ncbi:hypothetical protein CQW23_24551 [Capsicum baccatum]|uniref:Uncharacterized protein n=1 Tax=Capsicum baccatum TaxID=33114 RepID=A0A2G2VV63_CAPBA|nr:hypothetical protein CQW23_24551 [Capsicum baccatum]
MNDMPTVSFRMALYLAQIKNRRKFIMFDYGSAVANMDAYGSLWPLDLGEYYFLIDILVDLVAGRNDKVIRPSMALGIAVLLLLTMSLEERLFF